MSVQTTETAPLLSPIAEEDVVELYEHSDYELFRIGNRCFVVIHLLALLNQVWCMFVIRSSYVNLMGCLTIGTLLVLSIVASFKSFDTEHIARFVVAEVLFMTASWVFAVFLLMKTVHCSPTCQELTKMGLVFSHLWYLLISALAAVGLFCCCLVVHNDRYAAWINRRCNGAVPSV